MLDQASGTIAGDSVTLNAGSGILLLGRRP
jgi:hypothetical protein